MNVWRLIAHHEHPEREADYYRRKEMFAIGWSGTGDLSQHSFRNARELTSLVAARTRSASAVVSMGGVHSGISIAEYKMVIW